MNLLRQISPHALCSVIVSSFVLSLYILPPNIRILPRNDPVHIKARIVSISVTVSLLLSIAYYCFLNIGLISSTRNTFFELIGIRLDNLVLSVNLTIFLMLIFYMGPLTVQIIKVFVDMRYKIDPLTGDLKLREKDPITAIELLQWKFQRSRIANIEIFRNLIFAPICEELVFRALLVPILFHHYCGNHNVYPACHFWIISVCSSYFAIAHVHHFIEKLRSGNAIVSAFLGTLLQTTYTSIFGAIAVILFLRTGNFFSPVISHVICNFQGLPDLSFMHPTCEYSFLYRYRLYFLLLHALGLLIFSLALYPLTESFNHYSMGNLNTQAY